jgi:ATP-binding cassette subfamily F protein 3
MAGLLLGTYNILVLDEPGNHLDVETVESLAEALIDYKGTVIFTSHDRHFMSRIATNIIEVRDGSARAYEGGYEGYLYYINREIEDGERSRHPSKHPAAASAKSSSASTRPSDAKQAQKEMKTLEKSIKTLDNQRIELTAQMENCSSTADLERLTREVQALEIEISAAEERWLELNSMEF